LKGPLELNIALLGLDLEHGFRVEGLGELPEVGHPAKISTETGIVIQMPLFGSARGGAEREQAKERYEKQVSTRVDSALD
jgi:hypothetical protein